MFEEKKREYFTNLGLSLRDAIRLQKRFGLFEKVNLNGEFGRKHQAPEHMLVVTARARVLGEWLGLMPETVDELTFAAAIHDAYKAKEFTITKALNFTWESFEIAGEQESEELQKAGISQELIDLAHAAGHPLNEAQRKIASKNLGEFDWAWLTIFYVDNYTSGVSWASANPIDERFERDQKKYVGFNDSAAGKIEGHPEEKGFPAMIRIGKSAQEKIAKKISELRGIKIEPSELPLMVDEEIKRHIQETSI